MLKKTIRYERQEGDTPSHASWVGLIRVLIIWLMALPSIAVAQGAAQPKSARDSVYMVRIPEGRQHLGAVQTGFRLRGIRGIVTALHGVVDGAKFSAINDKNEVFNNLTLGSLDIKNDVAILISNDARFQTDEGLPASQQIVGPGVFLRVLGHPLGIDLHLKAVQTGDPAFVALQHLIPPAASEAFQRRQSPSAEIQVLDIETPLVPGDSGAPVLDSDGGVVGVVDGGLLQGRAAISWAIPLRSVHFRPMATLQGQIETLARQSLGNLFALESDAPVTSENETILWQYQSSPLRMGRLTGHVNGPNGQPLAGATIEVFRFIDRTSDTFAHPIKSAITNDRGEYDIAVVPGGYHLTIHKQSYEQKQATYVSVFPGTVMVTEDTLKAESPGYRIFTTSVGFTLPDDPQTAQVSGRITDFSGEALAGAFVTATDSNDSPASWHGRTVKTDSTGQFKIVKLPAALYDLTIESRGFRTVYLIGIPTWPGYNIFTPQQLSLLRQ